jgi:hypothetical protein
MLTTVNICANENVLHYWGRPRATQPNRYNVRSIWEESPHRLLEVPKATADFNDHMGGTGITDQRRCYYYT